MPSPDARAARAEINAHYREPMWASDQADIVDAMQCRRLPDAPDAPPHVAEPPVVRPDPILQRCRTCFGMHTGTTPDCMYCRLDAMREKGQ